MRVLYATDGGAAAVDARRLLEALVVRERTHVTVTSVVATGVPQLRHLSAALRSDEARRAAAHDAVDAAVGALTDAGFEAEGLVRDGPVTRTLADVAAERGAEVVVAGSGLGWVGGRLLGSVSTNLLHTAPTSVLIVHAPPRGDQVAVVAGVDGSSHALHAIDVAARMLDPARCAVTVVGVGTLLAPTLTPPYTGYAVSAPSPQVEEEVHGLARAHADDAVRRLTERGLRARAHVVLGHPVRRLLTTVDDLGAGLAVVGSRGLGVLDRAVMGSVSDQVVRHAPATLVGRQAGEDPSAADPGP